VHDRGVVLACKNIAGTSHIGSELINLVEALVNEFPAISSIAQIGDDEIVGFGFAKFWIFEVDSANPEVLALETFDEMRPDEPASAADKSSLHYSFSRDRAFND
jgi:hypothetical protein